MLCGLIEIIPAKKEHTIKLFEETCNKSYNYNKTIEQSRQNPMMLQNKTKQNK